MSNFFKVLGEKFSSFPQYSTSRMVEAEVQRIVVDALKVKNINEVRDRFEGQAFLDKQLKRVSAKLAVYEHLGMEAPAISDDWIGDSSQVIRIRNQEFSLNITEFGDLPDLSLESGELDVVITYLRGDLVFSVIGVVPSVVVQKLQGTSRTGRKVILSDFAIVQELK